MKKIKKIVSTLFMLVFTVTVLSITSFASSKATLNASRAAVKESSTPYVYTKTERRNTAPSSHFKYYMNDKKDTLSVRMLQMNNSKTAYCVEYQVPVAKTPYNATRLEKSDWWKRIGTTKQDKLVHITLYGYPNVTYSDVPACDHYVATQCLIWETIEGKDLTYLLQSASSKKAYQRIKTAVNNHRSKPSFDNKTLVLAYDKETKTYKGSVTDTNNKLDEFSFSKIDGVTIKRNGNTLEFETDKEIKTPVTMRGNKTTVPPVKLQAPLCYENPKHQTVVSGTRADPVVAKLSIKSDSGDIKLEKQSEDKKDKSQKFRITNKENGIDITVMTDENGEELERWISTKEPHIIKGLEAEKTYKLKETIAPKGYILSETETEFTINNDGKPQRVVMFNEPISIHTTAKDKADGDKFLKPQGKQTIIDTVAYKGLTVGKEYTIKTTLMNKRTNKPIMENGKPVVVESKFVAEKMQGTVDVEIEVDVTKLAGEKVVVFEEVYYDEHGINNTVFWSRYIS